MARMSERLRSWCDELAMRGIVQYEFVYCWYNDQSDIQLERAFGSDGKTVRTYHSLNEDWEVAQDLIDYCDPLMPLGFDHYSDAYKIDIVTGIPTIGTPYKFPDEDFSWLE